MSVYQRVAFHLGNLRRFYDGFHDDWGSGGWLEMAMGGTRGTPKNRWMVFERENPIYKWMMTGGIYGGLMINDD